MYHCLDKETPPILRAVSSMQAERSILEWELKGAGLGGTLLHLLRLGSISSLYVVKVKFSNEDMPLA